MALIVVSTGATNVHVIVTTTIAIVHTTVVLAHLVTLALGVVLTASRVFDTTVVPTDQVALALEVVEAALDLLATPTEALLTGLTVSVVVALTLVVRTAATLETFLALGAIGVVVASLTVGIFDTNALTANLTAQAVVIVTA